VKSQTYSDASFQAVLDRLDHAAFLEQLGIGNSDFVDNETETRCYCPVCHDRSKMSFVIERDSGRAYCTNLSCQASSMNAGGGTLLELYALAKGTGLDQALEELGGALGVKLERRAAGETAGQAAESFHFVEVGHMVRTEEEEQPLQPALFSFGGQEGHGRGVVVPVEDLPEFTAKFRADVYRSHFLYGIGDKSLIDAQSEQGKLVLLGDFFIVFNASSSAEIVHAINQAIELVERLKENYDIPYDAISVYYTNRNIEVHVDYTVFGIAPTDSLHEIFRRMACAIIGVDPLKPERSASFSQIDLDVYRHDYLYNIPGTMVSTGGRDIFKIRMSYAAFKKMSYQRLHEFSLRRPDLPVRERWAQPSSKASEFFNSVRTSLVRDTALDESDKIASLFYRVSGASTGIASLKELAPTLLRRLFDESRRVLTTPSAHLNRALAGGLYPGQLYIVAGFPGSGSSAMVLQMMNHVAAEQDVHCLFVGFQHGVEELFKHSLSSIGHIPASEIDEKRQNPTDLYDDKQFNRRIFAAFERYQQYADDITILEGAAASNLGQLTQFIQDKKEELRGQSGRPGTMLLIVDSLQLMVAMMRAHHAELALGEEGVVPERQLSRWDVGTLTSRLKALARELDIVVLATFEHYVSHRGLFSELSENDPEARELLFNTQFADTVTVVSRQGNSLLNLRDYFKTHLIGTPREAEIEPIHERLQKLETDCRDTKDFESLNSEFVVLDIIKNRSGALDKILAIYHRPYFYFEPLEYLDDGQAG